jgi:hypothetical protein
VRRESLTVSFQYVELEPSKHLRLRLNYLVDALDQAAYSPTLAAKVAECQIELTPLNAGDVGRTLTERLGRSENELDEVETRLSADEHPGPYDLGAGVTVARLLTQETRERLERRSAVLRLEVAACRRWIREASVVATERKG